MAAFAFAALTPVASAHHSRAAIYDLDAMIEAEGRITEMLWRNPHIRFSLEAVIDGETVIYEIESTPPGTLLRHGIGPEIMDVGQYIRVAGTPGRFDDFAMEAKNILLPDGREVLIQRDSVQRWSGTTTGWASNDLSGARVDAAQARATGIFRVWSRDEDPSFQVRQRANLSLVGLSEYPLTPSARRIRQDFDPVADNPIPGCTPKTMPHIVGQPYPIEFVDEGERILQRIEEYDLTRVIHMTDVDAAADPTLLGHSVGHWEDQVLVVRTEAVLEPQFTAGIPLSDAATIEERFELSDDQTRLHYLITVTDPATFTEPVTREKYWIWIPGVEIQPYECLEED